ncbi:MAG: tRNA (N(6)-L-threonylcarbamoyladenosine(37)-C(2))-methylthiotransferase MtaB [Armatimonadetes bacterium]|nr:tRNA (N(6)-L-threonylcarbamoyladenosine(37)-C(2))-methylthiotransferase MtaB [Armatimonadota bacterium]
MPPSFAIYTLGCKANQYDSYSIARELTRSGWRQVDFDDRADAYIVDTCTVTCVADHKSRKIIRRAARRNSDAIVAVTGCAAEWAGPAIQEMTGAEMVVRNRFKDQLPAQLNQLYSQRLGQEMWQGCRDPLETTELPDSFWESLDGSALPDKVRFLLKVQDGCNKFCTYCIIPKVRGRSRSRPVKDIVTEAREIVTHGFREIVLTGIQLGDFGLDLEEGASAFLRLIEELAQVEALVRLRISSILPQDISPDLIALIAASPRICRHLHIPLQSGSDSVLEAMRRGYTSAEFLRLIDKIREAMPGLGLTTDIMVGFPGETEEDFQATLEVAQRARFARTHIFKYSRRPGTLAERLPAHVHEKVKEERSRRMFELSGRLSETFACEILGQPVEVLVETTNAATGFASGYTDTYVRVVIVDGADLQPGGTIEVIPTDWRGDHLVATSCETNG